MKANSRAKNIQIVERPAPNRDYSENDLGLFSNLGMYGLERVRSDIRVALADSLEMPLAVINANRKIAADLAIPAQRIFKDTALFDGVVDAVSKVKAVAKVEVVGPFINVAIKDDYLMSELLKECLEKGSLAFSSTQGQNRLVVIDTSSPNIAKKMHLGHLRSTVIGESLSRIFVHSGYVAVRDNHLGDWGVQFGLLAVAHGYWAEEFSQQLESEDPSVRVEGLLGLYIKINAEVVAEEEASEGGVSDLRNEAREWFKNLEQGSSDHRKLWQRIYSDSLADFQKVYDILGVDFEYYIGESVYDQMNRSVIDAFKAADMTHVDERGTLKVNPRKEGADALAIETKDGTTLYGTRDIATIAARKEWFTNAELVYVVGSEQGAYFRKVFAAYEDLYEVDLDAQFAGFGEIALPEGKMSTRKGTVVFLEDVFASFKDAARELIVSKGSGQKMSAEEVEQLADDIAVGSLVYFDLMGSRERGITFNPDEAVRFEGNTGPSMQYAVARMNSILPNDYTPKTLSAYSFGSHERQLLVEISHLQSSVAEALDKLEPSVVAMHAEKIKSLYNAFYEHCPIKNAETQKLQQQRLQITYISRHALGVCMHLLNIPTPSRM